MKLNVRNFFLTLGLLILAGLAYWGWYELHLPGTLPIKSVKVQGQYQYVSTQTLEQTLLPFVQAGFFNVDISAAQDRMIAIPGVAAASIRRVWPSSVVISITEQVALARWQLGGFLSSDGTVFLPAQSDAAKASQLPLFIGQVSDIPALLSAYQDYSALLKPYNLTITLLSVDALGDWQLKTNAGFLIDLGSENMDQRINEFLSGYPTLLASQANNMPIYVDMRYRNGFAVKWQYPVDQKRSSKRATSTKSTPKKKQASN